MLETVSKDNVEIFSVGVHNGDRYTRDDLHAMVSAFNALQFEPIVKAGHEPGQEVPGVMQRIFGAPSLGYVKALRVAGDKLLADLKNIPRRFANLINAGAFKKISPEIFWDLKDSATGKVYPRVLRAIAFLGAAIPAVTNLKDIEALYHGGNGAVVKTYEFEINQKEFSMEPGQTNQRVSMSQASFAATEQVRAYAQENKMSFRDAAQRVFAQVSEGASATQKLGALIAGCIQVGKMEDAIMLASSDPALARDCASEFLQAEADKLNVNLPGMKSEHQSDCIQQAMKTFPAVGAMQSGGVVSEAAIKEFFSQWFKS